MATEMKGVWSLTTKSTGTTASYKIGTKEVVKLTNLNSSITQNADGTLPGVTVTEDESTGNKITLSESALGTANVAFTSSTYTLELDDKVPQEVEIKDVAMTVTGGKATVKGTLTKAYILAANGKTVTYSAEKTGQELATISNLSTDASTSNVELGDDTITLSNAALKTASPKLTLKNGAAYTLALDSDVAKPTISDVTVTNKSGTATITGMVEEAGYSVSGDGKTVNYVKTTTKSGTLATVKNLKGDLLKTALQAQDTTDGSISITIPESLLNEKDVTISSTNGYKLAIDSSYSKPSASDQWAVSGTTATYKQVQPAYYEYDGTKIAYHKTADVQTYATVKGVKSELTASGETVTDGTNAVITVSGDNTIKLKKGALTTSNVTLTSDDYSLVLDGVDGAVIDTTTHVWSLSGKNGGIYKANVTTAGWGLKDSKTVTYTAVSNGATVGTITGLKSGITKDNLEGIEVDTTDGTFTIPEELLTDNDVVLVNGNGFGYSLTTDEPLASAQNAHSWQIDDDTPTTARLFYGKSAYYTASTDGNTLTYNKPVQGSRVAVVQNLKEGTTADLLPTEFETDSKKNNVIKLSKDVLDQKTVILTGTGYALTLDDLEGLKPQSGNTIWNIVTDDKTTKATKATLSSYTTEGWVPNSTGNQITYTAPITGSTLATIEGYKNGLTLDEDGNFKTGITVYNEAKTETITATKDGGTRDYDAKTIAIGKAAVGSGDITLTSTAGYKLAVGKDLVNSEADDAWTFDTTKGTATYTYITPAGYKVEEDGTTTTFSSEKSSKYTATLTGLKADALNETAIRAGVEVDNGEPKTITLSSSVLTDKGVTIKGNYVLKTDSSVKAPKLGDPTWDISAKGTAKLNGSYTVAGYSLDDKGTTLTYTPADSSNAKLLATVSGLTNPKSDEAADKTVANDGSAGLEVDNGVITVSQKYLGTSKVTVKTASGSNYSLEIGDDVEPQKQPDPVTGWVVKGTGASYQSYTPGYYDFEEKTGAIVWHNDSKATVYATVSGLVKDSATGADLDAAYDKDAETLTLTADQLGTAKVTLTNKTVDGETSALKLKLDSEVPQGGYQDPVTEWVRSGNKATYQTYNKGYYTLSGGNTVTFTKDKDVTVHLTLTGVIGDVTKANMNTTDGIITLNATQLNSGKNKVTTKLTTSKEKDYTDYTIALAKGVSQPKASAATWEVDTSKATATATYLQPVEADSYVLDAAGTTVTYYLDATDLTLATLTGLNKTGLDEDDFKKVTVTEDATSGTKVITLTSDVLQKDTNTTTKVSVKEKGYTLAIDSDLAPTTENEKWIFTNLKKSGTAVYQNNVGAGYVVDSKGTSVSYSAAKDANAAITLSGLNKNYSGDVDSLTAAAAGITISGDVVTLSNADLLTTSKITLKNGTGANYTLDVASGLAPKSLGADEAIWTIKGTTATLHLGTSAGYTADTNGTSVTYVKENPNEAIATLSGLGKNAKVEGGKLGTITNKVLTQGVFIHATDTDNAYKIVIAPEVLGTTDVELENKGTTYTYSLSADGLTPPDTSLKATWDYVPSKGTATLYKTTVAGWTLDGTTKLVYTPGKENAVLTTFSGLSKTFEGNIDKAINTPTGTSDTITVSNPDLLGTGTASLKNATGYTYSLVLGSNIPNKTQSETPVTQWLTSGAKASLKTYNPAYFSINDKGAIVYTKAADVKNKVYAEVSGIKKDVDISDCVSGNVITLGEDQLDGKTVTLTNKTVGTETSEYTLALANDSLKATPATTATWVTGTSTTANLTATVSAGFTANSEGTKLTYTKDQLKAVIAVIKGVNKGAMDGEEFTTANTTISPDSSNLSKAVTVDGKEAYAFSFDGEYDDGKITGASTADTITVAGDNVTIAAGAGNDSIVVKGTGASVTGGKGDDSITSNGSGNTFYYATGDGDDVIANFAPASDKIMTNAKGNVIKVENVSGNAVITIGAGTKTEGTITLTGKGSAKDSISIVDTKNATIKPSYEAASDVLLADDNYSMNAAAVTDITDAFHASYTPYDFETGLDLVKKDSFTPVVSYTSDK